MTYSDNDEHMLTTVDNPFNPHTQFDQWYAYDRMLGHHTTQFLARIARTSDDLSDADEHAAIEAAIDEIVRENVTGLYRKIKATDTPSQNQTRSA